MLVYHPPSLTSSPDTLPWFTLSQLLLPLWFLTFPDTLPLQGLCSDVCSTGHSSPGSHIATPPALSSWLRNHFLSEPSLATQIKPSYPPYFILSFTTLFYLIGFYYYLYIDLFHCLSLPVACGFMREQIFICFVHLHILEQYLAYGKSHFNGLLMHDKPS